MPRITLGRAFLVDAGWSARQDDPLGGERTDPVRRDVVPDDLAIDLLLTHPAGDELGVLRTEIEHEDPFGLRR